ncbi:uncharacterized protein ASPGLDRAFT_33671 [Aspergillus glaucus CBS 516.65]|uniref:Uncharacterized protein n=1 Tax=Aspergillus glaucus CBS 516.65 TaxID=1160497 RepID=A0A1L9VS87_ASPGL|nr:hypothetical protein ASPGLDRAFT_33671 [Aspergillus glaucus CBS 516.65]OJJ86788.1 hypothetical protein ASPGLDRAFT_33671 [Aspergillus glaucus CBS 516.65]
MLILTTHHTPFRHMLCDQEHNNGGIARVFGRPKILKVVFEENSRDGEFYDTYEGTKRIAAKSGIYTFREHLNKKKVWEEHRPISWASHYHTDNDSEGFAPNPNLSLNVGIKHPPPWMFKFVALFGLLVQCGVLAYAGLVTYCLRWDKDGLVVPGYGFPVYTSGTLLLSIGMFLCACLIEMSTKERIFRKRPDSNRMFFYWIQPGNQVIGDQVFGSFAHCDKRAPLTHYITSMAGFLLQFIGSRASHSSIAVVQLGVTLVMSGIRASLRSRRLHKHDNLMGFDPDRYEGYELDWLASTMAINSFEVLIAGRSLDSDMEDIIEKLSELGLSIIKKRPTGQTSENVPVMWGVIQDLCHQERK